VQDSPLMSRVRSASFWISSFVRTRRTMTKSWRSSKRSLDFSSASGLTRRRSILVQRAPGGMPFLLAYQYEVSKVMMNQSRQQDIHTSFKGATPSRTAFGSSGNFEVGLFKMPFGFLSSSSDGGSTIRTRFSRFSLWLLSIT
jgi:hypothetical protein